MRAAAFSLLWGAAVGGGSSISADLVSGYAPISLVPERGIPELDVPVAILGSGWLWGVLTFWLASRRSRIVECIAVAILFQVSAVAVYYGLGSVTGGGNNLSNGELPIWMEVAVILAPLIGLCAGLYAKRRPWSPFFLAPLILGLTTGGVPGVAMGTFGSSLEHLIANGLAIGVVILAVVRFWQWRIVGRARPGVPESKLPA